MSDPEKTQQALRELWDIVRCRCHEAYTGRGLHDPNCECDSADAVKVVADRIEELEAKLDWVLVERDETFALMLDRAQTAEAKLAKCEKYRDAYAECDRIATQAVRDLEAKLAKAVEAIETMQVSSDAMMLYVARTTLAELTGGKDE